MWFLVCISPTAARMLVEWLRNSNFLFICNGMFYSFCLSLNITTFTLLSRCVSVHSQFESFINTCNNFGLVSYHSDVLVPLSLSRGRDMHENLRKLAKTFPPQTLWALYFQEDGLNYVLWYRNSWTRQPCHKGVVRCKRKKIIGRLCVWTKRCRCRSVVDKPDIYTWCFMAVQSIYCL